MAQLETDPDISLEDTKRALLRAMNRGLNVTANAVHIRDLAAAYALLEGTESPSSMGRTRPRPAATPLTQG